MELNQEHYEYFEFLSTLDNDQLAKYFAMLGPEECEYAKYMVRAIGTELNMVIAELHDEVEDLAYARGVLSYFTLSGKVK